jgi:ATP-dependent Clp protease, protease subunit
MRNITAFRKCDQLSSCTSKILKKSFSILSDFPHFAPSAFIPAVVEATPRYERVMDIYSRLLRERIICVHGPIDDELASVVTSQLLFLESEDPGRPLSMYINSPGGVVTSGLAIYDTMQYIKCPITTLCIGQAASMGSLLLAGGSPGLRYALPNSKIMLHQPSGGVQGMASDINIQAQQIQRTKDRLNLLYQFHTGMDIKTIERVMDRYDLQMSDVLCRYRNSGINCFVLSQGYISHSRRCEELRSYRHGDRD